MPAGSQGWKHDELAMRLKEKVGEIDALQEQLARNKCAHNKKWMFDLLRTEANGR